MTPVESPERLINIQIFFPYLVLVVPGSIKEEQGKSSFYHSDINGSHTVGDLAPPPDNWRKGFRDKRMSESTAAVIISILRSLNQCSIGTRHSSGECCPVLAYHYLANDSDKFTSSVYQLSPIPAGKYFTVSFQYGSNGTRRGVDSMLSKFNMLNLISGHINRGEVVLQPSTWQYGVLELLTETAHISTFISPFVLPTL